MKVPLDFPVEHAGKTYESLTLRRLTIGDRLKYPKDYLQRSDVENEITMLALMADVDEEVIKMVEQFCDYPKLSEVYISFLDSRRTTSDVPAA